MLDSGHPGNPDELDKAFRYIEAVEDHGIYVLVQPYTFDGYGSAQSSAGPSRPQRLAVARGPGRPGLVAVGSFLPRSIVDWY